MHAPSLKFRPDTQAGDSNMGDIITWKIQKAINLDEIICAVGVKRVNYNFQCFDWGHTHLGELLCGGMTKNHWNIRDTHRPSDLRFPLRVPFL